MKYLKKLFESDDFLSKYHADPERYGYRLGRFIPDSPPEQFVNFRGGRDTGHFGTGFYFVGVNSTETIPKDPSLIFDLKNYNLYHPRNDNYGYKLHDILKELTIFNNTTMKSLIKDIIFNKHVEEISKNFITIELDNLMDDDKMINYYNKYKEYYNNKQEMIEDYKIDIIADFQKCHKKWYIITDIIRDFLKTNRIMMFIKDIDFYILANDLINKYEKFINKEINKYISERNECYHAILKKYITPLVDLVSETCQKPKSIIQKAAMDTLNEQSEWDAYDEKYYKKPIFSTRFFSKLGYDGIDVRNTNLDNTMYGCVIWNIKPEDVIKVK